MESVVDGSVADIPSAPRDIFCLVLRPAIWSTVGRRSRPIDQAPNVRPLHMRYLLSAQPAGVLFLHARTSPAQHSRWASSTSSWARCNQLGTKPEALRRLVLFPTPSSLSLHGTCVRYVRRRRRSRLTEGTRAMDGYIRRTHARTRIFCSAPHRTTQHPISPLPADSRLGDDPGAAMGVSQSCALELE